MTDGNKKQRVLDAIDAEQERWRALVARVGPENMETPGAMGDWTFKDLAAHLTGWRERGLRQFESRMSGRPANTPWPESISSDDWNAVNDWLYEQNRDRPASELIAAQTATYDRLRDLVSQVPEAQLFDADWSPDDESYGDEMLSGEFFGHFHDEHEADVNAWLASLGR